jgi:hypothetical protein
MRVAVPSETSWLTWLTLDRLVTAIVFLAIFTMAVRPLADTDVWWHLQAGRWMVENQQVPRSDTFSHSRLGEPWIDHGWLAQAAFYALYAALGYAGPALFVAALVTLAYYFVWRQCLDGDRWLRAFVLITAAVASGGIWAARPQIVTFTLAAAVAYLLHRHKQGSGRAVWFLPPLVLLWVNVHGGFAVAFILMLAYLFAELVNHLLRLDGAMPWRALGRLALVMGVCLLVVPLNPNGATMWAYPFQTVAIGVLKDYIVEWRPPNFHELHFHPFIWLLLATLTALGLSRRRADFTELTLVALFTYLSLLAARNVALFALVAAPVVVRHGSAALADWRQRSGRPGSQIESSATPLEMTVDGGPRTANFHSWWRRGELDEWGAPLTKSPVSRATPGRALLNWTLLALFTLATLLQISQAASAAANEASQARHLPTRALAYLEETRPAGPIFNSYNWGGYLIWKAPDYPVFVDGRTDLYGDSLLRQYTAAIFGHPDWRAILDEYGINLVLIESRAPLTDRLEEAADWRELYRDEQAVIFARR